MTLLVRSHQRLKFLALVIVQKRKQLLAFFGVPNGIFRNELFGLLVELVILLSRLSQFYFQLFRGDPFLLDHVLTKPQLVLHFALLGLLLPQRLAVQLRHLTHEER